MLRTHENSDVFNTLDEIYLVFTSKKVNILYISKKAAAYCQECAEYLCESCKPAQTELDLYLMLYPSVKFEKKYCIPSKIIDRKPQIDNLAKVEVKKGP